MTEFEEKILERLTAIETKLDVHLRMHSFVAALVKYSLTTTLTALGLLLALKRIH